MQIKCKYKCAGIARSARRLFTKPHIYVLFSPAGSNADSIRMMRFALYTTRTFLRNSANFIRLLRTHSKSREIRAMLSEISSSSSAASAAFRTRSIEKHRKVNRDLRLLGTATITLILRSGFRLVVLLSNASWNFDDETLLQRSSVIWRYSAIRISSRAK